ncbi:NrtR DNA-binding winged helix domain-containing protein [Mesorhizobium argentiipisi]|uniref:NrtR DNA-binding winged helix domain-containing protein n=1 Tax=Mesorhizobium argentiipisi TaxID=3015175 RepID=A0ABU8KB63_9HYPH
MGEQPKGIRKGRAERKASDVKADLTAVVVAVNNRDPCVLTIGQEDALPSGPFELAHRSLQSGLRVWVEQQTGQPLGYVEQLYTFADRDRIGTERVISITYLALTREEVATSSSRRRWGSWYDYFPWEDHRSGTPPVIGDVLRPRLIEWADGAADSARRLERRRRAAVAFGFDDRAWNEELALQRYELLFEARIVEEATRDGHSTALASVPGRPMVADHRRILATGIARLRSKIKYRPVVFELIPPVFTLLQLQRTVEALAGRLINKPNFRRLIEQQELVEETGETSVDTGGRPAKLYRFRHAVLDETPMAGTKLPLARA